MVGLPIREQDHPRDGLSGAAFELLGASEPATMQVGAAAAVHPRQHGADLGLGRRRLQGQQHIDLVVVDEQAQLIDGAQVGGDVLGTAQRLGQRGAVHAARAVNHQGQALGHGGLGIGGLRGRAPAHQHIHMAPGGGHAVLQGGQQQGGVAHHHLL